MKNIVAIFLVLYSCGGFACIPASYTTKQRINQSSQIFFGYVVGVNRSGFEQEVKESALFQPSEGIQNIYFGSTYTVLVKETVKGKHEEKIDVINLHCGHGFLELYDRVVIFRNQNYDFAYPLDENLYDEILANK